MARTAGSSGAKTAADIRRAGLALIFERGYAGMTLRDLAAAVGLSPGSLYNHFETKQALLFEILKDHMEQLLAALDDAIAGIEAPCERLAAYARFHVHYHMVRRKEVFVINSELRSLEPENFGVIRSLRRAYEQRLSEIISDGQAARAFATGDVRVTTFAVLAMLTGVCDWYEGDGRLGEDQIIALYQRLTLEAVLR